MVNRLSRLADWPWLQREGRVCQGLRSMRKDGDQLPTSRWAMGRESSFLSPLTLTHYFTDEKIETRREHAPATQPPPGRAKHCPPGVAQQGSIPRPHGETVLKCEKKTPKENPQILEDGIFILSGSLPCPQKRSENLLEISTQAHFELSFLSYANNSRGKAAC